MLRSGFRFAQLLPFACSHLLIFALSECIDKRYRCESVDNLRIRCVDLSVFRGKKIKPIWTQSRHYVHKDIDEWMAVNLRFRGRSFQHRRVRRRNVSIPILFRTCSSFLCETFDPGASSYLLAPGYKYFTPSGLKNSWTWQFRITNYWISVQDDLMTRRQGPPLES